MDSEPALTPVGPREPAKTRPIPDLRFAVSRFERGRRTGHRSEAFAPVLPITHAIVEWMPELVVRYPSLTARDLIHVSYLHGRSKPWH